jgi:sugar fermentation stimulation protein A
MIKAKLLKRLNRFTALVELNGEAVKTHVANSGRLTELFQPGCEVYLVKQDGKNRVTGYDLSLVRYAGMLVSVDARLPNAVVAGAVDRGELPEFAGYSVRKREVKFGQSRLDMVLENQWQDRFYIEVKSVTLVSEGIARFPDAPTERGSRHLGELAAAVSEGSRAGVVFLIQREDAKAFSPNDATDPLFGRVLRQVTAAGVEAYAYICKISVGEIKISGSVPVVL